MTNGPRVFSVMRIRWLTRYVNRYDDDADGKHSGGPGSGAYSGRGAMGIGLTPRASSGHLGWLFRCYAFSVGEGYTPCLRRTYCCVLSAVISDAWQGNRFAGCPAFCQ